MSASAALARDPMGVDLDPSLYALDSTTIDLCLAVARRLRINLDGEDREARGEPQLLDQALPEALSWTRIACGFHASACNATCRYRLVLKWRHP